MCRKIKDTLCWDCGNHFLKCEQRCCWSEEFKPVEGWVADSTTIREKNDADSDVVDVSSFLVHECPLYIKQPYVGKKEIKIKVMIDYFNKGYFVFYNSRNNNARKYLDNKVMEFFNITLSVLNKNHEKYYDLYFRNVDYRQ